MITPLEKLPEWSKEDIAFIRISALYNCYYGVLPAVKFFEQKNDERVTAVISKADNVINLSASPAADFEELRAFVFSLSGTLFCSDEVLRLLETGLMCWCGDVMKLSKLIGTYGGTDSAPDIKSLYLGMKQEFSLPSFEDFYADIFYRRRQNGVHFSSITKNGCVVSSAMTVAENNDSAIIGGVFTLDEFRGKGLASDCVRSLCSTLDKENIYLLIRDGSLCEFYGRIGFEKTGIWTETEI